MIEIKIKRQLQFGGFDYEVRADDETTRLLEADAAWGKCASTLRRIMLPNNASQQQFSYTFTHESLHAISDVYLAQRGLSEEQVSGMANGLLQLYEQLGIRFVKGDL